MDTTAAFWDRVAPRYAGRPIDDEAAYLRTLEITRFHLSRTHRALELGAGTGSTAVRLAPFAGHMTATDVSGAMIGIARDRAWNAAAGNLTIRKASTREALSWPEEWDRILAFSLLHLLPDLEDRLREIRSRLPKGGLFISKTPCLGDMPAIVRIFVPVLRAIGYAPYVRSFTGDELERMIRAVGFEIAEVHTPGKPYTRMIVARAV